MKNGKRYPEYILRCLRERNGLKDYDRSQDDAFQALPPARVFVEVLEWNGLHGVLVCKIKDWIQNIYGVDISSSQKNWFSEIADRLRDHPEGDVWSVGDELLCKTESAANMLADMIEQLYRSQGEEVVVNTGFYDPETGKRNGEEDRFTGWWYVNIE